MVPNWLKQTVVSVLIWVYGAINAIVFRNSELGSMVKAISVWAMLLALIFFHWGFAQLLAFRAHETAPEKFRSFLVPVVLPGSTASTPLRLSAGHSRPPT